jgi:predicted phage terminase large subunit-like protein
MDVERTKSSGNKTTRFLEIQPYLASKQISIPKEGRHTAMVLEHLRKITANDSHRHDDIADTLYDGVKLGIIDNVISAYNPQRIQEDEQVARGIMGSFHKLLELRSKRYGNR